jgi:hypothetical protein
VLIQLGKITKNQQQDNKFKKHMAPFSQHSHPTLPTICQKKDKKKGARLKKPCPFSVESGSYPLIILFQERLYHKKEKR